MPINNETTINTLYSHYEDTCKYVRELVHIRDRLFLIALALLGLQFFQISNPDQSAQAIAQSLSKYIGSNISLNKGVLNTFLGFALLSVILRYFQVNVFINRQYNYLHKLEEQFTELFGRNIITREGEHYLYKYPIFSDWINILYTWIFPILLILTAAYKIFSDWPGRANIEIAYLLSCLFFLMIAISTTLYLVSFHDGRKKE